MNTSLETINGLNKLTGLGTKTTQGLFEIIRGVLVHEIACEALDCEDGRLKTANACIPGIGTIIFSMEKGEVTDCQFKIDKQFADSIKSAVVSGESELLKKAESTMVSRIKERYEALV